METKDLYKTLEVKKDSSQEEIRRSYRKLARKHHPDANRDDPNAENRFKDIQHAYEILSNPEKRREYDEGPRAFFGGAQQQGGTRQGAPRSREDGNFTNLSDLLGGFGNFGDVLGNSRQRSTAPEKGESVTVNVNLKFADSLNGVTTRVNVPVEEGCGVCRGTGAAPGTNPKTCPDCGGLGMKSRDQGFFAFSEPCAKCGGRGRVIEKPCATCGGAGRVRKSRQVNVKIPAGVKDGTKIRIPGRGSASKGGGQPGDLYVVTGVEKHPVFGRRGDDFVIEAPVSFVEAALGAEIRVPKPAGGMVRLRLPAGTQDGKQFKVGGAGAPRPRDKGNGDLIVRVSVVVPKKLKKREREILEAFAEEHDQDVREDLFRRVGS